MSFFGHLLALVNGSATIRKRVTDEDYTMNTVNKGRMLARQTDSTDEPRTAFLTLTQAAKLIPGRSEGKTASVNTLWRWCIRGVHGTRLRSVLIGGRRCTTSG